ncbi:hypothetical protein FSP39_000497 [Pinctada imbricata]|uniref:Uncharacterized protein n=1 Tax=Pinctada imbricata TaxID=66713 RepID=A0AA88Y2C2_PINIB|nr:hypothetical protein FSP39_000497 [Pinctada imbricata]
MHIKVLSNLGIENKKKVKEQVERTSSVKRKWQEWTNCGRKPDHLQSVQNKPFKLFYDEKLKHDGTKFEVSDSLGVKELFLPTRGYKSLPRKQSEVIKKRPPTDSFLIRRPVGKAPAPAVHQEDILFKTFTKQLEFKLKNFPTIKEQYYFYQSNFPLLLDQYKEADRSKISIKRIRSPENAIDPELKRGIKVKSRLFDLKKDIDSLEEESDCEFETELRTGTFDPTSYPWNKKKRPFPPGKASRKSVDLLRKASLLDN